MSTKRRLIIEGNQSEVARVMRQIRDEYEAVQRVFTQSSIVSRHDFITRRQENIATHVQTLRILVGDDQALALLRENDQQMTQEAEHDAPTQVCSCPDTTIYTSDTSTLVNCTPDTAAPSY